MNGSGYRGVSLSHDIYGDMFRVEVRDQSLDLSSEEASALYWVLREELLLWKKLGPKPKLGMTALPTEGV